MTTLPVGLRDWAGELEGLSVDSLAAFTAWLPRLAATLGPLAELHDADQGEPDGFAGISNKGRYERLLMSEWLLADEAPLEFMRRAAAGQQLFKTLARKAPAQSRCCFVLVDAGPSQLGVPRLAQLATLIVLARRARQASARLLWGIVQAPGELHEGLEQADVRSLLAARTLASVDRDQLERWNTHLRTLELRVAERWLISDVCSTEFAGAGGFRSTIWIGEALPSPAQGFARTLRVEIHDGARAKPTRALALELPDDRRSVEILRDPFRVAVPKPASRIVNDDQDPATPTAIWIDQGGQRLFARNEAGTIDSYHLPTSARQSPGLTRRHRPKTDEHVLGVGARGKGMVTLTIQGDTLRLGNYAKNGRSAQCRLLPGSPLAAVLEFAPECEGTLLRHFDGYLFRTGADVLIQLQPTVEGKLKATIVDEPVIALTRAETGQPRYALCGNKLWLVALDSAATFPRICVGDFHKDRFVGFGWSAKGQAPLVFCEPDGTRRVICGEKRCLVASPEHGEQILGPLVHTSAPPSLLVLDASRHKIIIRSEGLDAWVLHSFSAEIVVHAFCPHQGVIAVWTANHGLWAYRLSIGQVVLNLELERGESA